MRKANFTARVRGEIEQMEAEQKVLEQYEPILVICARYSVYRGWLVWRW